jgi:hypothetical protein
MLPDEFLAACDDGPVTLADGRVVSHADYPALVTETVITDGPHVRSRFSLDNPRPQIQYDTPSDPNDVPATRIALSELAFRTLIEWVHDTPTWRPIQFEELIAFGCMQGRGYVTIDGRWSGLRPVVTELGQAVVASARSTAGKHMRYLGRLFAKQHAERRARIETGGMQAITSLAAAHRVIQGMKGDDYDEESSP